MKNISAIKITSSKNFKKTNFYKYQHLISKLIYLTYKIRPNITFVVGQLSKNNSNPRIRHLLTAKKVFKYMKRIMQMSLVFGKKVNGHLIRNLLFYRLSSYTNSNFAWNLKDLKSVIGYYYFLNGVVILWKSKKQRIVFIPIAKTKYITLRYVIREVVWIKQFFNKIELEFVKGVMLNINIEMSIILMKNKKNQY